MRRAALLVAAALAAGCGGVIDPCAGKPAACIGVHLDSNVASIDALSVGAANLGAHESAGPFSFPVRFAVLLPSTTSGVVPLRIDGLAAGSVVASAAADVALDAHGHGSATLMLGAALPFDGAVPPDDLSAPRDDLAATDLGVSANVDLAAPRDLATIPDLVSTDLANEFSVTLAAVGGHGTLSINGQDCIDGCTRFYPSGTSISVTQTPAAGYAFTKWSGACNTASGPCMLTLTANTTLSALYARTSYNLTVVTASINGGSGTATPNTTAIGSCGTGCYTYTPGTSLAITTTAAPGSTLFAFGGGKCTGTTCGPFTMDNDYIVTASFVATGAIPNIVFPTSATYSVTQLGSNGANADGYCQTAATNAGFANASSYKAWLSTTATSAVSKLGSARGWVRPDGMPFADTIADLTGKKIQYPANIDETNKTFTRSAWTGTSAAGTLGVGNCSDWTVSTTSGYGVGGEVWGGNSVWTYASSFPCNTTGPIYCFGTASTAGATVTINTSGTLRKAFSSWSTMMGSGGIALADSACAHDAQMAGLSGTFIAYLETDAPGGGLQRFDTTLGPWALPDGRLLSLTAQSFTRAGIMVPVERYADGSAIDPYSSSVLDWVGAPPLGGSLTCSDWTVATGNGMVLAANTLPTSYQDPCSNVGHLLCLQK